MTTPAAVANCGFKATFPLHVRRRTQAILYGNLRWDAECCEVVPGQSIDGVDWLNHAWNLHLFLLLPASFPSAPGEVFGLRLGMAGLEPERKSRTLQAGAID